jgi:hypothetical protein
MPWNWLKSRARDRKSGQGGDSSLRDSSLLRLLHIIAEEPGVHAFIARATGDQGVVTAARTLVQPLLRGEDVPEQCRTLCRSFGVSEGLLRSRLWAMASLFPGPPVRLAPYRILGLMPGARPKLVQGAFRKLCLKWHPDLNPGDPEAARRFLQIRAAYDMLAGAGEACGQSARAAGSGACAWDVVYGRPRRTGTRMRLLMPLILVVGVLVLAVAVTDLESPRVRSAFLSSVAAVGFGPVINASVCSGSVLKLEPSCLPRSTGRTASTPGGEANHPHR